jgi:hypothetical protein
MRYYGWVNVIHEAAMILERSMGEDMTRWFGISCPDERCDGRVAVYVSRRNMRYWARCNTCHRCAEEKLP